MLCYYKFTINLDPIHKVPPLIRSILILIILVAFSTKCVLWDFLGFGGVCYVILISHCLWFLLHKNFFSRNLDLFCLLLTWKYHELREVLVLFLHYISRAWYSVCPRWCKGIVVILLLEFSILCLFLCHF